MNKDQIKKTVNRKYAEVATSDKDGCGCACACGGRDEGFSNQPMYEDYKDVVGYEPEADLGLGCGIPTEHIEIKRGQVVVDLGSGAGNDCFVAANLVGPEGLVIGVDMTREMINRAREHAKKLGYKQVKFRLGDIEDLPITANKADVIVSNCVINLVPDKYAVFNEIMRVLKPGGQFSVSDIVVEGLIPDQLKEQASFYAGCISGAVSLKEYLHIIEQTGFKQVSVVKRKRVELPDSLVKDILSAAEYRLYQETDMGIYSVTVLGSKPTCLCN